MNFLNFLKGNNQPTYKLDKIMFLSSDHIRYENGIHVSGPHGGAKRGIKIEPNIQGDEGYTVTIYNMDGAHPIWGDNIQVAPKQMKIMTKSNEKVVLRGFGHDGIGNSFAEYGLTVLWKNEDIYKCILHMHDRNVDIEYLNNTDIQPVKTFLEIQAEEINNILNSNNKHLMFESILKIISYYKENPQELNSINLSQIDYLDKIEQLAGKASNFIINKEFIKNPSLRQILSFTLLFIYKVREISNNERYIEDKLIFFSKQPNFMLYLLMIECEDEVNQLNLFNNMEDYSIKVLELLSAEIILTSFLKNYQHLLYNHSFQQFSTNRFYPITDKNALQESIKKIETILLVKLSKLVFG